MEVMHMSSITMSTRQERWLGFKPDFARTVDRFEAWWNCEVLDRPPTSLGAVSKRPGRTLQKVTHATPRDRWLDVEYNVEAAIASMERCDYVGDSFPCFFPNVGPELTATLYGCELEFSEGTSWSRPVVHDPADWDRIAKAEPNFDNPYWRTIEQMTDLALQRCDGRYIVGMADLHGNYDILAALRDPETLCLDLVDCPDAVRRAGKQVVRGYIESFNRLYAKVHAAGHGSTTWCQTYHQGPMYLPNCDFWCMVNDIIAREWILPDIVAEMAPLQRSLFHLDGPQALRHLDLLLELPQLTGVQWVYGDGHGPATAWIDVYRRIIDAGKCIQVVAHDPQDALDVLRALGPEGLWLCVWTPFHSTAEADAYLEEVARCSRRQ